MGGGKGGGDRRGGEGRGDRRGGKGRGDREGCSRVVPSLPFYFLCCMVYPV